MARTGIARVKTGCTTCKLRRIKCDEARPLCARCVSTGRKCDGYVSPPIGSYSWAQLLRSRPPQRTITLKLPGSDGSTEADRAMHFYHRVAAPAMTGALNKYFWTTVVSQVASQEPVASHAVLALSSLYEAFSKDAGQITAFAVWHYNESIRLLQTTQDRALVLFICVLFICIELLRKNYEEAIAHCRHGINILNELSSESTFLRNYVIPAIRQLNLIPYCFGSGSKPFPTIERPVPSSSTRITSVAEAHARQIPLQVRLCRFLRFQEERLLSNGRIGPEPGRKWTRNFIILDMDAWYESFRKFKASSRHNDEDERILQILETRHWTHMIQILMSEAESECEYDAHIGKFRTIVDGAAKAAAAGAARPGSPSSKPTPVVDASVIEMGYGPLLFVVVQRCRFLRIRMAALKLMEQMARPEKNVWAKDITAVVARRLIEIEHQISLDDIPDEALVGDGKLPPEDARVVSVDFRCGPDRRRKNWRKVLFLLRDPEDRGKLIVRDEWLLIAPRSSVPPCGEIDADG